MEEAKKRLEELKQKIIESNEAYYRFDAPILLDAEYDN